MSSQSPIALKLRFAEPLVAGRLVRKLKTGFLIVEHIPGLLTADCRLDVDQFACLCRISVYNIVIDVTDRAVFARLTSLSRTNLKYLNLDGYAKIKIPAETQSGKVFRLRGKGIKGVRSQSFGDLLCHVVVETPVNLTARQRELLHELEQINDHDGGRHNPRARSWMDKVREFFES